MKIVMALIMIFVITCAGCIEGQVYPKNQKQGSDSIYEDQKKHGEIGELANMESEEELRENKVKSKIFSLEDFTLDALHVEEFFYDYAQISEYVGEEPKVSTVPSKPFDRFIQVSYDGLKLRYYDYETGLSKELDLVRVTGRDFQVSEKQISPGDPLDSVIERFPNTVDDPQILYRCSETKTRGEIRTNHHHAVEKIIFVYQECPDMIPTAMVVYADEAGDTVESIELFFEII